jgi:hypothetical protein
MLFVLQQSKNAPSMTDQSPSSHARPSCSEPGLELAERSPPQEPIVVNARSGCRPAQARSLVLDDCPPGRSRIDVAGLYPLMARPTRVARRPESHRNASSRCVSVAMSLSIGLVTGKLPISST